MEIPKATTLALAIAHLEGWGVSATNIPTRTNNPGDLRASSLSVGNDSGYSKFPDQATGFQALLRQIGLDRDRGLTLQQFVYKFAPPSENNTEQYLSSVEQALGVSRNAKLSQVIESYPAENAPVPPVLANLPVRMVSWDFIQGFPGGLGSPLNQASDALSEISSGVEQWYGSVMPEFGPQSETTDSYPVGLVVGVAAAALGVLWYFWPSGD